jgi:hypothetical protein
VFVMKLLVFQKFSIYNRIDLKSFFKSYPSGTRGSFPGNKAVGA